jgi:hypothetical protein
MEQLTTFNKILKYIKQYQQQSPRMQSFGYGDIVYYATTNSGTTEYPLVFVTPVGITYDENITTYNLSVIFGDIVNTDMSNEASVVSDMSLEAKRFIAEIKRGFLEDKIDVELPTLAQPFFERFNDHIGGVVLDINIIVNEYLDACLQFPSYTYPNQIDGLFAWYDLQDTSTINLTGGTDISQLLDKSGNDYTLTPLNTPPIYTAMTTGNLSGFYSMYDTQLTGLEHNLSTSVSFSSGFTMFIVSDWEGNDSFRSVFNIATGNTFSSLSDLRNKSIGCTRINGNVTIDGNDYRVEVLGGSIPASNNAFITTALQEGITSDFKMYLYGTQNFEDLTPTVELVSPDECDYILLGDFIPGFAGDLNICEAIIYNRKLTDDEYNEVVDYLKQKYNFSNWS